MSVLALVLALSAASCGGDALTDADLEALKAYYQ